MRLILVTIAAGAGWGCALPWWDAGCSEEARERYADCTADVVQAVEWPPSEITWEMLSNWPFPSHVVGIVEEAEERRVKIRYGNHGRSFIWPEEIPFKIAKGEEVYLENGPGGAALYFARGALAFQLASDFGSSPPRKQRIGHLHAHWEEGCSSVMGTTLNLVVDGMPILPGEKREVDGWKIANLGGVYPEASGCHDDWGESSWAMWIASSTELRYECLASRGSGPSCSKFTVAANLNGKTSEVSFGAVWPGEYVVTSLEPWGLTYKGDEADEKEYRLLWPETLPIPVAVGDVLRIGEAGDMGDWRVVTLPRGELAIFQLALAFSFYVPIVSPDGEVPLYRGWGCSETESVGIPSLEFVDAEPLLPGGRRKVGEWTFQVLYARESAGMECVKGSEAILTMEGHGEGTILAYRRFD